MSVCFLLLQPQTTERIWMKFGMLVAKTHRLFFVPEKLTVPAGIGETAGRKILEKRLFSISVGNVMFFL